MRYCDRPSCLAAAKWIRKLPYPTVTRTTEAVCDECKKAWDASPHAGDETEFREMWAEKPKENVSGEVPSKATCR